MGLAGGGKDKANGRDPRGRKPGQRRRDALEKRRDRREAVQMKLREKLTSEEIAERLNAKYYRTEEEEARAVAKGKRPAHLSPAQIRVELKIAEEEFKNDTTDDLLQIRLQLLREFEDLEAYAWGRHYASIGEHKIVVETDGEKASTRTTTEELVGDRGWVELAAKCKEFRLRISGAEPPRKIAPTNPQGTKPFEFEQPEEFKRLAALAVDLLPELKDLLK